MDESKLKTSVWQRVVILIVAILLIGSMIFTYLIIVLGSSSSSQVDEATLAQIQSEYDTKQQEFNDASDVLSKRYLDTLVKYKSHVKAYNKANAEANGLETVDLQVGSGHELKEEDYDYYAYYIGVCPDGSVFESSFDNYDKPTALKTPLLDTSNTIAGWKKGVIGMKLGGVRQVTMNSSLAYGDEQEICAGEGATPLRYIILATEKDETLDQKYTELQVLNYELSALLQGGLQ